VRSILSAVALAVICSVSPAIANHDQGQGKSQDHLHRNPASTTLAVPALGSGVMLMVGVAVWLVYRRRR
jgi:uncharacterized membrane protein